jgi:hypothetical protein
MILCHFEKLPKGQIQLIANLVIKVYWNIAMQSTAYRLSKAALPYNDKVK